MKKRWIAMKEIIGKAQDSKKSNFPGKLKIKKTGADEIGNEFKKIFCR